MTTNKYSKAKIYKLVNNVDDKIYVGSTTCSLAQRKAGHKTDAKRALKRPVCKHFNEIGWTNVEIVLLENYACTSLAELTARERKWIDKLKPVLNITLPGRTQAQYQAYRNQMNVEKTRKRKEIQAENKRIQAENKRIQEENSKMKAKSKNKKTTEAKTVIFRDKREELVVTISCIQYKGKDNYIEKVENAIKKYREIKFNKTKAKVMDYLRQQQASWTTILVK